MLSCAFALVKWWQHIVKVEIWMDSLPAAFAKQILQNTKRRKTEERYFSTLLMTWKIYLSRECKTSFNLLMHVLIVKGRFSKQHSRKLIIVQFSVLVHICFSHELRNLQKKRNSVKKLCKNNFPIVQNLI